MIGRTSTYCPSPSGPGVSASCAAISVARSKLAVLDDRVADQDPLGSPDTGPSVTTGTLALQRDAPRVDRRGQALGVDELARLDQVVVPLLHERVHLGHLGAAGRHGVEVTL